MFNRAEVIDENFIKYVNAEKFPLARSTCTPRQAELSASEFIELFESQVLSRHLDLQARILKNENKCYYTIGSSGHEGNAAIGKSFLLKDMAFLHYRSCALMLQRSRKLPGATGLYDNMLSFFAALEEPIAGGRHKVFGSKTLLVPPQTSTIASHLPKAVGAAFSITKAKHLGFTDGPLHEDSIVLCSFGDASINHSVAVGAVNSACWMSQQSFPLPIVFLCEDNGIGISVPSPSQWVQNTYQNKFGLDYFFCDGTNLADAYNVAQAASQHCRRKKRPVFLHMKTVRLMGHAGSDMELTYKTVEELNQNEFQDPLLHSARIILENSFLSKEEILKIYEQTRQRVKAVSDYCELRPQLNSPEDVRSTLIANTQPRKAPEIPRWKELVDIFGGEASKLTQNLHFAKLMNMVLHETLLRFPKSLIFGEDVAQKGGVYNVTENIYKRFGNKRIFNSLLDETTILGTAIGLAHNDFLPIPEIQFLAYFHNAEDQIRGEAATLAFFSKGQFTNPMILRIAGLAYQKGFGGHFHNDNSINVFRDIPAIILAIPSNGLDAVKMFRTCSELAYEQGRVVVFIEPIALYMTRDLHEAGDKQWSFSYPQNSEKIEFGEPGLYAEGKELMIVTYGNGVYYSRQAIQELKVKHHVNSSVLDLRWITPLHWEKIIPYIKGFKHILFVEECRKTGSLSEQFVTGLVERLPDLPKLKIVAADDCFIPLGPASAAGLPKKSEIINAALDLLKKEKQNGKS